jgi:hypothetical protein
LRSKGESGKNRQSYQGSRTAKFARVAKVARFAKVARVARFVKAARVARGKSLFAAAAALLPCV